MLETSNGYRYSNTQIVKAPQEFTSTSKSSVSKPEQKIENSTPYPSKIVQSKKYESTVMDEILHSHQIQRKNNLIEGPGMTKIDINDLKRQIYLAPTWVKTQNNGVSEIPQEHSIHQGKNVNSF